MDELQELAELALILGIDDPFVDKKGSRRLLAARNELLSIGRNLEETWMTSFSLFRLLPKSSIQGLHGLPTCKFYLNACQIRIPGFP